MAGASPGPRVSAHLVPNPMIDDEEKTTIDPQWDDGSTTSEQHKVSQRLRALLADPRPSDSEISATAQPPAIARLVVTHGTDLGRAFEIHSGKVFTIGRSLDCDVVLTDIAVSRKHFDLRNDDGLWFIADRGSGNGTLVNNDLRNAPFQLVNGDIIEVGTTTLRFDCRATEIESEVSTISGRRQPPEIAALPELPPPVPPPAQVGPQALLQTTNARLPIMPTRPLVLGPHSPTLLGIESKDNALWAAIDSQTRRPPATIARVPTHVPSATKDIAAKEPTPPAAPVVSTRAKLIIAAGAAVTLAAIVAIAVVTSSEDSTVRKDPAKTGTAKAKFTLPVSELKAAPKPAAVPARAAPAAATGRDAKSTTTAAKPSVPLTTAPAASSPAPVPASTGKVAVAAALPAARDSKVETTVETVVDVRPAAPTIKQDRKAGARRSDGDLSEAKADSQFRAEKFNEAADTLRTLSRTTDRANRKTLENKAATYTAFGKAYVQGMTNNNPVQAFAYLRSATNYDKVLGGSFAEEITARMKQIAPKAAVAYIAGDKLSDAHLAVQAAERVGASSDSNVALVKQKLESAAAKLYSEAMGDLEDNPSEAKEKFRQIKEIVDANSQWFAKASKQLSGA